MGIMNWIRNLGSPKAKAYVEPLPAICRCGKNGYDCTVYNDQENAKGFAYNEPLCLDCMKVLCEKGCLVAL